MWIIELLLLLYFLYVVLYSTIFSLAGLAYKSITASSSGTLGKFCILIPAYKEDSVIVDTARAALTQSYPSDRFEVVVIADSLKAETLIKLGQLPITVVKVSFESSTKVKALTTALNTLGDQYDHVVILDADNVMETDFLSRMSEAFATGLKAIQGQRKPKNTQNTLALLDGVSEAINNHIYRQGTTALKLSASINGSGVAFDFKLFKEKITSMNSIGGFDRELELLLLKSGVKVHYHKDAVVFDEKVSQSNAFQNQRKRWISSQYFYLRKYFAEGMKALVKGDFTFFNSAVLRNIQLPRLINIGLLTSLFIAFFFIQDYLYFDYSIWVAFFILFAISIAVSIPKEFFNTKLALAIVRLPLLFLNMVLLLFKLKGANKKFIHTPHGVTHK